jgi:hypothetical protein
MHITVCRSAIRRPAGFRWEPKRASPRGRLWEPHPGEPQRGSPQGGGPREANLSHADLSKAELVAAFLAGGVGELQTFLGRTLRLTTGILARDERQLIPQLLGRMMGSKPQCRPSEQSTLCRHPAARKGLGRYVHMSGPSVERHLR